MIYSTGAVEDGSEIFYQVDRSALAAGMNGGGRSMPDVVHSSTGTLRKYLKLSPLNLYCHYRFMCCRTGFDSNRNISVSIKLIMKLK